MGETQKPRRRSNSSSPFSSACSAKGAAQCQQTTCAEHTPIACRRSADPNAHASAAASNAYKGLLIPPGPRLNNTSPVHKTATGIRHHLAGAMFLPFDPSAQNSWPPSKRARVSRQDFLGRRRSYQDAGIVFLFPENFSGEGRWITARHEHGEFPLDMFDAFFKRPRRVFVSAQRGIDLHPAIRGITRLDRPQPYWNSVLRHQRFLSPR